eukprot:TRINITY_DN12498_c0_g1_i4.p1 TRINITY_DN12498_c0_g1~~TRINITY_DN12498_c0_g1_i4.p1  ORF type:complete len:349 (+),score=78.42 TRINITY_DN12498_c0_g1_i4:36-1049(+)
MARLSFTKMQGAGNDFVVFHDFPQSSSFSGVPDTSPGTMPLSSLQKYSKFVADRKMGVGCDQVIIVRPSPVPDLDYEMLIFNNDGSQADMCGNGVRCFSKYILAHGLSSFARSPLSDFPHHGVHTLAGPVHCYPALTHARNSMTNMMVTVNMGPPYVMDLKDEEVVVKELAMTSPREMWSREVQLPGSSVSFKVVCVSMGNPHAVIFLPQGTKVSEYPVEEYGPLLERHEKFPRRANIEFVEVLSLSDVRVRVWERGAGETLACGTGACGVAVACILTDNAGVIDSTTQDRRVNVHMPGGILEIDWKHKENRIYKSGPATEVFRGEMLLPDLKSIQL